MVYATVLRPDFCTVATGHSWWLKAPCYPAPTAPVCSCLTVHEDILTQVPAGPWLCRLVVHSPGKSQVQRVRQHPPTTSQINPQGYIVGLNRITGLDVKLCLCSHQCCQFLHCKVGNVTHAGGGGRLQTAMVRELQSPCF